MSLKIIKAGILDSIQDKGRYGYQKYGINPTGAMDLFSCRKANILVNNPEDAAVIELHFPASVFLFEENALITLSGADFSPVVNDQFIPIGEPVLISKGSVLRFASLVHGSRCYLAVAGGFKLQGWLNSCSTNFKAQIGGLNGRRLLINDILDFEKPLPYKTIAQKPELQMANIDYSTNEILILPGPEWNWISQKQKDILFDSDYTISSQSDRMGYRLNGNPIYPERKDDLVSSPVSLGTIQLLPDGQMIVLMADRQTTGGYPRIATVITAHHTIIAQKKPGEVLRFKITDILTAERLLYEQEALLMK